MHQHPETHPWLFEKFTQGCHFVRRMTQFWGGLWTELVIEQMMMHSMKSQWSNEGTGVTESVCQQWIYCMIDPAVLFMRCTAIAHQQDKDIASSFKYEMTVIPTDLFKNGLMRKSNKADLARELQSELVNLNTDPLHSHKVLYEVDRGWRLHRIH